MGLGRQPRRPPGIVHGRISLEPDGGGTLLTLRHAGLPDDATMRMHGAGWDMYLDRLDLLARGEEPPPFVHPLIPTYLAQTPTGSYVAGTSMTIELALVGRAERERLGPCTIFTASPVAEGHVIGEAGEPSIG